MGCGAVTNVWGCAGLVDASCGLAGYRESAVDPVERGPKAIADLLSENGVRAVRSTSDNWASRARFRRLAPGIAVVGGSPVLVDGACRDEADYPVSDHSELTAVLDAHAALGMSWISVRPSEPGFLRNVVAEARARGLRVSARGPVAAGSTIVDIIDSFAAIGPALVDGARTTWAAVEILGAWAVIAPGALAEHLRRVGDQGVAVSTELLALRRAVFVKESLEAPYLERLTPITPHTGYLIEMRRGGGYLAGRRALARHSGATQPSRAQIKTAEAGWRRLVEGVLVAQEEGVLLLPGSRAPQLTVVPGYGLLEELALLVDLGLPAQEVLSWAGTRSPEVLGLPSESTPLLTSPRVPSTPADVLMLHVKG